jgi:hypothetical protein
MSTKTILAVLAFGVVVLLAALLGYRLSWTGFADYEPPRELYYRGKTLWDWLDLLVVPLALALAAVWLTGRQNRVEHARAMEGSQFEELLSAGHQQQEALAAYLDRMTSLLLTHSLRSSPPDSDARNVARAIALSTLRSLDGRRKGLVL